jgi:hypothetical protein
MRITPRMKQLLQAADLKYGEVNDVPWSTWRGLKSRGLATHTPNRRSYTTRNGPFPLYHRVLLTQAGISAARGLQGLTPPPSSEQAIRAP